MASVEQTPCPASGEATTRRKTGERPESIPRILLVGFYGRGNYGDDLMAASLVRHFRTNGVNQVAVVASDPEACRELAALNVELVPRNFRAVLASLRRTDILCQGGGTHFHDSYSGKYLLHCWKVLATWVVLFWTARLRGVRVILVGSGLGPFRHRISRWLTRMGLAACDALAVRDTASVRTIEELGTKAPLYVGFDVAALAAGEFIAKRKNSNNGRVLGISGCSLTPMLKDAELNQRYWSSLGDALARFAKEQPVRIVFFSMFTGTSSPKDDTVADLIAMRLPQTVALERCQYDGQIAEMSARVAGCDWFLGAKYHSVIAAYLCGCECAVIPYNRKVSDLADQIGVPAERRVSVEKVHPVDTWLRVLNSFVNGSGRPLRLETGVAADCARRAVDAALADAYLGMGIGGTE